MTDEKIKADENPAEEETVSSDEVETEEKERKKTSKRSKAKQNKKVAELEKKIKSLEQKSEKLAEENKTAKDQLLRKVAEFENYKRRTEKEFINHLGSANEELILEILPVIDDFERSLQHFEETDSSDPHLEGIRLIYKKLVTTLEKKGLHPIDAVGQDFDPDEHQALLQVDSEEFESGQVVEEHQKGYKLNEKVIRHSQVLVAK